MRRLRKTPVPLSRRGVVLGLVSLPLAGCGFRPVYGPGGPGLALRDRVRFQAPQNRLSFALVAQLEARLGRSAAPDYDLSYSITTRSAGIAVSSTNDTTRVRLTGEASYVLRETATEAQVLAGEVTSFTAYSTTGSTLATDAAERDAETRLMHLLADLMADDLISGAARFR